MRKKLITHIQPGPRPYDHSLSNPVFESLAELPDVSIENHVQPAEKTVSVFGKKLAWVSDYLTTRNREQVLKRDGLASDMIYTSTAGADAIHAADHLNINSIYHIRSIRTLGLIHYNPENGLFHNFFNTDWGGRTQYPFLLHQVKYRKEACNKATIVVCCSEFVKKNLEKMGISSHVIYPPLNISEHEVEYNPTGSIGMVGPKLQMKGGDIFLDIADAMPDEEFLVCGPLWPSLEDRLQQTPNVEYMGELDDMKKFYRNCKLLVVPSRWPEGFGRVAAEAMVSGIPVVVSNQGALPEVVGDTAPIVSDVESTEAWISAIDQAFSTHQPEEQKDRVMKFKANEQISDFQELVTPKL